MFAVVEVQTTQVYIPSSKVKQELIVFQTTFLNRAVWVHSAMSW